MATKTKKRPTTIPGLEGLDLSGLSPDDVTSIRGQQALVYSPQLNQIRDLHRQLGDQYKQDLSSAGTNADSARMYATKAIPEVQQIFANAKTAAQAGTKTVNGVMDKYGAGDGADPFRRALAREQQSASDRIANEGAKAHQELKDRVTAAESGRQFAIAAAKKDYRKGKDTLSQKLLDILQEQGASTAGMAADIRSSKMQTVAAAEREQAKLDSKAADKAEKHDADESKRIKGVRDTTNSYVRKIADAEADWHSLANDGIPQTRWTQKEDKDGHKSWVQVPVIKDRQQTTARPTPSQIKVAMGEMRDANGHLKYTPGDVHIMLLASQGKPLDAAALAYLKRMKDTRIPRAWIDGTPEYRATLPENIPRGAEDRGRRG